MSRHIVTINHNSLQDTMKFEGCGECKTSCTIGNLACTEQQQEEE